MTNVTKVIRQIAPTLKASCADDDIVASSLCLIKACSVATGLVLESLTLCEHCVPHVLLRLYLDLFTGSLLSTRSSEKV